MQNVWSTRQRLFGSLKKSSPLKHTLHSHLQEWEFKASLCYTYLSNLRPEIMSHYNRSKSSTQATERLNDTLAELELLRPLVTYFLRQGHNTQTELLAGGNCSNAQDYDKYSFKVPLFLIHTLMTHFSRFPKVYFILSTIILDHVPLSFISSSPRIMLS